MTYRRRHGRAYALLWDDRERLAPIIAELGRKISWAKIAAELATKGLKARGGKPAKAEAVRRAWVRVREDMVAEVAPLAAKLAARVEPLDRLKATIAAVRVVPPPDPVDRPRYTFKPATLRRPNDSPDCSTGIGAHTEAYAILARQAAPPPVPVPHEESFWARTADLGRQATEADAPDTPENPPAGKRWIFGR